jgi:hypothetical protein
VDRGELSRIGTMFYRIQVDREAGAQVELARSQPRAEHLRGRRSNPSRTRHCAASTTRENPNESADPVQAMALRPRHHPHRWLGDRMLRSASDNNQVPSAAGTTPIGYRSVSSDTDRLAIVQRRIIIQRIS